VAGKLAPPSERLRPGLPGRARFIEVKLGVEARGSSFVQTALELEVSVEDSCPSAHFRDATAGRPLPPKWACFGLGWEGAAAEV